MLPRSHAGVLRRVSRDLSAARVRHGVGGSCLLALLGLPVTVRDVDIEVDPGSFPAVTSVPALHGFSTIVPYQTRGAILTTPLGDLGGGTMARGSIDGVTVEVFEHPGLRSSGRWRTLPLRTSGSVAISGDEVPLADTGFWWALYTRLDPDKAALLAPLVPASERARAADELGLPGQQGDAVMP